MNLYLTGQLHSVHNINIDNIKIKQHLKLPEGWVLKSGTEQVESQYCQTQDSNEGYILQIPYEYELETGTIKEWPTFTIQLYQKAKKEDVLLAQCSYFVPYGDGKSVSKQQLNNDKGYSFGFVNVDNWVFKNNFDQLVEYVKKSDSKQLLKQEDKKEASESK
ncbi:B9_protein family domain-containing protein [Hexamita inflata]|uniref:B9 protein family domain-containing protein n=1 Tax=Hexamita inflata TaxID=28002 RepID=A0AA86QHJ1_9EUKA|nr:B9 protein family domain-containing protein [Hexamita inflata]